MAPNPDVIVVGSGPSGVSVAFPMLEAGMRVMLIDGGLERDETLVPRGAYHDVRRNDTEQWRLFLGPELEALRPAGPPSPKFDAPGSRFAFAGFAADQRIEGHGFAAIGSLARGGLSNIWGAGVSTWGDAELAEFPVTADDLRQSYRAVASRIGVSGFGPDDVAGDLDGDIPSQPALPVAAAAERLLARYARRRSAVQARGLRVGRPRAAVLSEPHDGRKACQQCDMCIWGCRHDSIYTAVQDLARLTARSRFDYRPGCIAEVLHAAGGEWAVDVRSGGGRHQLRAQRVVLAAGALATTRLVLQLDPASEREVPVIGAPGVGFAVLLPALIGSAVSTREFSMAQMSFSTRGDDQLSADDGYGSLFPASGVPASLVAQHMPVSRPAAVRLFRRLQPAMLLGNCFLPGRYSRNVARLDRTSGTLVVHGGVSDAYSDRVGMTRRQLVRGLRVLGAIMIPGSFKPIGPGEEVRYAGMLPMRDRPRPGECDRIGELYGHPGLHVVDLAAFPAMSAKHHTLTLMANADRIGRAIGARSSHAA